MIVGEILHGYRWPAAFYFGGTVVSAWVVLFVRTNLFTVVENMCSYLNTFIFLKFLLCYDNPNAHPFISDKEKQYLTKELGSNKGTKNVGKNIPWKRILTSAPVWSLIFIQVD